MSRVLLLVLAAISSTIAATSVTLVVDPSAGPPARHGVAAVKAALERKHFIVRDSKKATNGLALEATIDQSLGAPESLKIIATKGLLRVTGADDRGLMYALLDIANRIDWSTNAADPFAEVHDTTESPDIKERAVSIYTMSRPYFESRLFDEKYWAAYLDMLAANRFNSFVLIFGYENGGYLAPAYPYLFDVDGFPDVRVVNFSRDDQQRYYKALKRLIAMAHARGINVTAGLWDHIYRGGVQGPDEYVKQPTSGLVWGLNERNVAAYITAAVRKFLKEFPEIDGLQFRMHNESGLKNSEMRPFWDKLYSAMKDHGGKTRFTFRVKEFPDDLIDLAADRGVNFRLSTKYWMEQMGLPFHPTHVPLQNQFERRHSYGDLLHYPQRYGIHWRLWNGGTARLLLWADPEYARRFLETTKLYDGEGFEVNEPLATKMLDQRQDTPIFGILSEPYRYYTYEFERYWHFFQVFGRLAYNPSTPPEIWHREFKRRLGVEAAPLVERALHKSSEVLPRIVASVFPYDKFPTTRGWPEKQRWGDLAQYAQAEGSDTQQFEGLAEAARRIVTGGETAKITPETNSRWFHEAASEILRDAGRLPVGLATTKELESTLTDLKILAGLARYHAVRIPAGVQYALFEQTNDVNALDAAIRYERDAIAAWEQIVAAAGDVYAPNLIFGLPRFGLAGHWRDELVELRKGLTQLERRRDGFRPPAPNPKLYAFGKDLRRQRVTTLEMPNGRYEVKVGVEDPDQPVGPMWIETNGLDRTETFILKAGQHVTQTLRTTVVDGKLHIALDTPAGGRWWASTLEIRSIDPLLYHAPVRGAAPGSTLVIQATANATSRVRLTYRNKGVWASTDMSAAGPNRYGALIPSAAPGLEYSIEVTDSTGGSSKTALIPVIVSSDNTAPSVIHTPVTGVEKGQPLMVRARAEDTSGIRWLRIRYRAVNQYQDFRTLDMQRNADGEFVAQVPVSHIDPRYDLMYFIEAMDNAGNGRIYPDLEKQTPYTIVRVAR